MKTVYVAEQIPSKYSLFSVAGFSKTSIVGGKKYTLLGLATKKLTPYQRIWIGVQAFAKTAFTLGFGLLAKRVREDWRCFWQGRQKVILYAAKSPAQTPQINPSNLTEKSALVANKNLPVAPAEDKKEAEQLPLPAQADTPLEQVNSVEELANPLESEKVPASTGDAELQDQPLEKPAEEESKPVDDQKDVRALLEKERAAAVERLAMWTSKLEEIEDDKPLDPAFLEE